LNLTERRKKEIASMSRRKHRDRLGELLIEGVRSVAAALDAKAPLVEVLVSSAADNDARTRALLDRAGVPVHTLSEREIARISDVQTSQGILAVARTMLFPETELSTCRRILVLDGIQDPGNAGTIIRSAAWFGVDAVLSGPDTVDFFNPKTVRAAMGGLWDVRLSRTDDLAAELSVLHEAGFALYGADLGGVGMDEWQIHTPSVLVLGSEAHGLSASVRAMLDERITIVGAAGARGAESLNVAVAAGILMHHWLLATG